MAATSGPPVFLGIHATPGGTTTNGESMDEVMRALEKAGHRVDAVLLMCSPPDTISATLPALRAAFRGPRYPETQYHAIDVGENTPARYAGYGRRWLETGAQIVGGCCATTPGHIAALAPVVMGR